MQAGYVNSDWGMAGWYDREEYNDNMQTEVENRVGEYTENKTIAWLEDGISVATWKAIIEDLENRVGEYTENKTIAWLQARVSADTWKAIIEDLENRAEQEITEESENARAEYEYNKKYD